MTVVSRRGVDILHRVGIADVAPQRVYEALAATDGIASWWSTKSEGHRGCAEPVEFMHHCSTRN